MAQILSLWRATLRAWPFRLHYMSVDSEAIAARTFSASLGSIHLRLPVTDPEIIGALSALTSMLDRPQPTGPDGGG